MELLLRGRKGGSHTRGLGNGRGGDTNPPELKGNTGLTERLEKMIGKSTRYFGHAQIIKPEKQQEKKKRWSRNPDLPRSSKIDKHRGEQLRDQQ